MTLHAPQPADFKAWFHAARLHLNAQQNCVTRKIKVKLHQQ